MDVHQNPKISKKKFKKKLLSQENKRCNCEISKQRIKFENVLALLNGFRILSSRVPETKKEGIRIEVYFFTGLYNL